MHSDMKSNEFVDSVSNDVGDLKPAMSELKTIDSAGLGSLDSITAIDDAILGAQGHKAAMPRVFSALSSLGLGFSITNSWVGALSNFGQNLKYGGPQCVIFALLVATFVQWAITLGLSELASAFPSSGGQYHFVYILAPQKYKRVSAFVVGWMSILAWWISTCSGLSLCALSITGLASFVNPSFVAHQWHVYLVYVAMALFSVIPLLLFPKLIPKLSTGSLYLTVSGCLVWFICMLAMKKHTNDGSFIVESNLGTSGWGQGTAWVLGVSNAMYCYGGTDAAIHISEEMKAPGRKLPQVMNLTMLIGFLTCVPIMVVCMFVMTDMNQVMNAGFPAIEVLYQATDNRPLTIFLSVWLIIIYASCMPPQFVTCGRIAWAFARDKGLPFSGYFSHIDTKLDFPVRATLAALAFNAIYGLLYLASTSAFNSIVTSAVLFLNITLAIPQAIVVIRGRKKHLPERPFNLGYVGYFCNIFAPLWILVLVVLVCMPPSLPVTVGDMNYTSPIIVGLFGLVVASYFFYGHQFEGPKIDWELLNLTNHMEVEAKNL